MNNSFWNMVNGWYENIGEKIKGLAKWTFVIEAICSLIAGFVMLFIVEDSIFLIGLATIVFGPIIAFVSSWLLSAFGHLVQTTEDNFRLNARQNNAASKKSEAQVKADNERIKKIEALRAAGMITEEEYLDAMAKINGGAV